ncbi:MAG: TM2 domain-containing protein [Prevotellaceae bacterium]|jgi:TM2 domain-containing membrane protein YozV|nr:TM2 domain-containing protein [Prevotellaceae bacterium]
MNTSRIIRYEANKRLLGVAVVFCIFFGFLGLHRFYVNQRNSGMAMLILSLVVVGLPVSIVWSIVDLFLIDDMVCSCNNDLADKIEQHYYHSPAKKASEKPDDADI